MTVIKVERAAFEDAVAAFLCAMRKCEGGTLHSHEWRAVDAHSHEQAIAAVRGALSALFNAPVFIENEHAEGLPEERA